MGKNQKGTKMSMAEFMGGATPREVDSLPSGPKQRGPDDDGAFRRNNNSMRDSNRGGGGSRNYNGRGDDYGDAGRGDAGRSDGGDNWRRGGGVPQKEFSREDGDGPSGGSWRGGGGNRRSSDMDRGRDNNMDRDRDSFRDRDSNRDRDRDSFGDRDNNRDRDRDSFRDRDNNRDRDRDSFRDRDNNRDRDSEDGPSRADGDSSWRSGRSVPPPPPPSRNSDRYGERDNSFSSRSGSYRSSAPVERERPRLQLSKRTLPVKDKPLVGGNASTLEGKKKDPFGGATALGTAAKLSTLDIKDDKKEDNGKDESKRPPAMPINSRAAALEVAPRSSRDSDPRDDNRAMRRDDRGPYDRDRGGFDRNRGNDSQSFRSSDNRGDRWGRDDRGGYDNIERGGYDNRSNRDRQSTPYDQQDRRSNRGSEDVRTNRSDDYPRRNDESGSRVVSSGSLKGETFNASAPPPTDSTLPTQKYTSISEKKQETNAGNKKSKENDVNEKEVEPRKTEKEEEEKKHAEQLQKVKAEEELLQKFISLKGDELLDFCKDNESTLSNHIETLTNSLFKEHKNASWTSTHKSALQSLIPPDNMSKQLDVLFAVQKYCHSINFPKESDKNVILSYFEIMLSEDIVSFDAFFDWKDDEQKVHEQGKMKAIIQTMDWFNYLEDMVAGDDEEYYDDEYDEDA